MHQAHKLADLGAAEKLQPSNSRAAFFLQEQVRCCNEGAHTSSQGRRLEGRVSKRASKSSFPAAVQPRTIT
jgi:hypothetical protein